MFIVHIHVYCSCSYSYLCSCSFSYSSSCSYSYSCSLFMFIFRGTINQLALRKVLQVSDQKITLHCNLLPRTVPSAARPTWIAARCENLEKRLRQHLVLVIFKTLVSHCLIVYFYAKSRLYLILFAFNTFCR